MDYPDRFTNAVDKLVEAFFDGTLEAGDCSKCAVGNICDGNEAWKSAFQTRHHGQTQYFKRNNWPNAQHQEWAQNAIESTGYSVEEMARVEKTFEKAGLDVKYDENANSMEDQYNRLMAVLDVLMDIEGIDEAPEVRERFNYKEKVTA